MIVGFGAGAVRNKRLFDYPEIDQAPHETKSGNINPYLVDAPDVVLPSRKQPLVGSAPRISFGSMPNDGGHLLLSDAEKAALLAAEPGAERWIKRFLGAQEFINNTPRWCLWLKGCPPGELRALPLVAKRVAATKHYREASTRDATRKLAAFPTLFGEDRQPATHCLLIPSVSSERRQIIPIGFMSPEIVASNLVFTAGGATVYDFGILSSTMHNAWVRYTCGRLESRYRYSAGIVYNNLPWPLKRDPMRDAAVAAAAQAVLDARASHANASLADLYDPNTMPPNLVKAHRELDRAVDAAYLAALPAKLKSKPKLATDAQRVAFLFELYLQLTSIAETPPLDNTAPT